MMFLLLKPSALLPAGHRHPDGIRLADLIGNRRFSEAS